MCVKKKKKIKKNWRVMGMHNERLTRALSTQGSAAPPF